MLPTLSFLMFLLTHSEKCSPSFAGSCACLVFSGDTVLLNLLARGESVKLTGDSLSTASIFDESMVLAWKETKQRSVWLSFAFCAGTWIWSLLSKERDPSPAGLVLCPAGQVGCGAVAITSFCALGAFSCHRFWRWNEPPKMESTTKAELVFWWYIWSLVLSMNATQMLKDDVWGRGKWKNHSYWQHCRYKNGIQRVVSSPYLWRLNTFLCLTVLVQSSVCGEATAARGEVVGSLMSAIQPSSAMMHMPWPRKLWLQGSLLPIQTPSHPVAWAPTPQLHRCNLLNR